MPLPLNGEPIAEIIQLATGALIIRTRPGRRLRLTDFAKTALQTDGAYRLSPIHKTIEMSEAVEITGLPYTTLRRIVEMETVIKAYKRSPGRWALDLASVLEFQNRLEQDPEFWENIKAEKAEIKPRCFKVGETKGSEN